MCGMFSGYAYASLHALILPISDKFYKRSDTWLAATPLICIKIAEVLISVFPIAGS